jgi:hypothetical protein
MTTSPSRASADTRHRVPYPNARPRRVTLVGLGAGGRRLAATIGREALPHVDVVAATAATNGDATSAEHVLRGISAGAADFERSLDRADMVFVVATPGDDFSSAARIAALAHGRGLLLTGVIVEAADDQAASGARSLDAIRRACDMLVVTADASYVAGMLEALGVPSDT